MGLGRVRCIRMQKVVKPDRIRNPAGPVGGASSRSDLGLAMEKFPGPPWGDWSC